MNNVLKYFFGKRIINGNKIKYERPVPNHSGKIFEVNNWIISDFIINELYPIVGNRPFPLSELNLLTASVVRFKPQLIFEWGTNIGKSARIFYEVCKTFNLLSEIHTINLTDDVAHVEHPHNNRGLLIKEIKSISMHQGDGLETALSIYQNYSEKKLSMFFLDGDHSYESVKRELFGVKSVIENAIILVHDTFYQTSESGYNIGPYQAVKEFLLINKDLYQTISTDTGLPGLTLLYPKNLLFQD